MDTNIIAAGEAKRPTNTYAEISGVLRELADALAGLDTEDLAPLTVGVTLQPVHRTDDEDVEVATVDAIAEAIGTVGGHVKMSSGSWHYHTERNWRAGAGMRVAAFCAVTGPEERAARTEADRLRAENEQLRAQLAERDDIRAAARRDPDDPESYNERAWAEAGHSFQDRTEGATR